MAESFFPENLRWSHISTYVRIEVINLNLKFFIKFLQPHQRFSRTYFQPLCLKLQTFICIYIT